MMIDSEARVEASVQRAMDCYRDKQFDQADELCREALEWQPQHVPALNLRAMIAAQRQQPELAAQLFGEVIQFDPAVASAHYNRGNALRLCGRHAEALACYEAFIALRPDVAAAHFNRGNALRTLGRQEAALAAYDEALRLKPDFAAARHNRGNALRDLGRHAEALADYDRAIELEPAFTEVLQSRADLLYTLRRYEDALDSYGRVLELGAGDAQVYAHRGNALVQLRRQAEAIASYDQAIALDPSLRGIYGARLYAKLQICDWREFAADCRQLTLGIERGDPVSHPFCVLAVSNSAALQRQAAENWVRSEWPTNEVLGAIGGRARHRRIRVGYFSADFGNHPVSRLCAELFEVHDRKRFKIMGFSFGANARHELRARLERSFDRFIDVRAKSDLEIAQLARRLELDIAVDLGGYTENSRPGIFALRAAPLQLAYLGYLGTTAAPTMDYLVADETVIPPQARPHYSEQLIWLPSYQVNDSKRGAAERMVSRQELGLPERAFVYCCFNSTYKILPESFANWMRILAATTNSVLLLYADHETAAANLRDAARAQGVDPDRLVFAQRATFDEYLARYRAADLFLDTLPYNAGATASDALWMGLPVLTCPGATFASRVAASLLTALELPELIAATPSEYVASAVDFALRPGKLAAIKQKLVERRQSAALFDARRFAANLEAAYRQIVDRWHAQLPPESLRIADRMRAT